MTEERLISVYLTRGQIARILEWSTAAGDTWGDDWNETDEYIVKLLDQTYDTQ